MSARALHRETLGALRRISMQHVHHRARKRAYVASASEGIAHRRGGSGHPNVGLARVIFPRSRAILSALLIITRPFIEIFKCGRIISRFSWRAEHRRNRP